MASAAELVWQWAYLMAILLIIFILICCFCGCWGSFSSNVRGFCADGISCGFAPFRKKKKKVAVVTVDGKRKTTMLPEDAIMVRTAGGETVVAGDKDIDPWGSVFGCCVSLITCFYCCGTLKPEGEGDDAEQALLARRPVVAQPVTVVAPAPLLAVGGPKKPNAPPVVQAVKAEPVAPEAPPVDRVEPAPTPAPAVEFRAPPRDLGQGATGAHVPLMHFYTFP